MFEIYIAKCALSKKSLKTTDVVCLEDVVFDTVVVGGCRILIIIIELLVLSQS